METQITIPVLIQNNNDIKKSLEIFTCLKQETSSICFNEGKRPLNFVQLYNKCYKNIKGRLSSQMTCNTMRCVAGAYASAWKQRKNKPIKRVFNFKREMAVYSIGDRGRDASFRNDGLLSIWTITGRKKIPFTIPEHYQNVFKICKEHNCLTIIERNGQLEGKLCCTIEVPDTNGIHPVGIDLNQTNTLVATDSGNHTLFISGKEIKQRNNRNRKTRSRLQRKLALKKAENKSTRSVRRCLKRLGKRISNRNRTFAGVVAKKLCEWVKPNSILVFEALSNMKKLKYSDRKGNIRKSNEWNHSQIRLSIEYKSKFYGHSIEEVNPAYTSQICSKCGAIGTRIKHSFSCVCGHREHADINASKNIRNRFTILRGSGCQSIHPEAQVSNDCGQVLTVKS